MISVIERWAHKLRALTGWKKMAMAYGLGVLAAFAFPPFHAIPLLWISFPSCLFLLQSSRHWRNAFFVGWWFAFGLLTISLYWIAGALFVDLKSFWWLIPFAVAGLPALFSIYYGIAAAFAKSWGVDRLDGQLIFALLWFLADYARGHLFTGFPWDIMGYVWSGTLPVLQITSIIGIYGLTLVTLVLAVLPAAWGSAKKPRARVFFTAIAFLAATAAWGQWRVETGTTDKVSSVHLRLVQPNISQREKWKHEDRDGRFRRLLDQSFTDIEKSEPRITHVIWPETATPFLLMDDPVARTMIAQGLSRGLVDEKRILMTGGLRRKQDENGINFYLNSFLVLDEKATINGVYDKHHLVPFGEYIPFADYLPIRNIVSMGADFMAGIGAQSLHAYGFPSFSPLVCYEAIFSDAVIDQDNRPNVMVNVTNDGWYEGTIGPAQHYAITRVRAIEEGIPLIRVANKGVTAVVDSFGRAVAYHDASEKTVIDSPLPVAHPTGTFYAKHRQEAIFIIAWVVFFAALWLKKRKST